MATHLVLASNSLFGQESCKRNVKEAIHGIIHSGYENLDVSYVLGTKLNNIDTMIYRNIEMKIFGGDVLLQSEDLAFYKNENISLTVKHDDKQIIKSNGKGMKLSGYMDGFMAMYDTMINRASIVSCHNESGIETIELAFPERITSLLKTTRAVYKLYNGKLIGMEVMYNSDYPIALFSIEIKKWDLLETPIRFKPAIARLLNGPSSTLESDLYPGYSFYNNLK